MRLSATLLTIILLGTAQNAHARVAPLTGKWSFNAKESELLPGEEAPAELVMQIAKDDDKSFQWTVTVKMADGQTGAIGFEGVIDGKPYPVKGRDGSTSAFSWLADGGLKRVDQSPGGIVVEICRFTGNMRRMNCAARQTDAQGRAASYVEVFDRE